MRILSEVEADLLTLDLPPMSSPKHNAHIQGCPRTMYKRQITNGSCCELHITEPRKAHGIISTSDVQSYMPMHYVIKKEIGKKKRILQPLLPNLLFVYTTRETVNSIIKKKGDEISILKFYLDKTKPLEENGKHPPLTIPFTAMINFIKATSTNNEHVRIVSSEQCHYKSGDIVKVIDGEFEGVTGKVARIAGQQRVVVEIFGLCLVATAYIPTDFIKFIK